MTATVEKIGNAGAAFAYYNERDDYYMSDKSSAEWFGAGAAALGLRGDIDPQDFHDVLAGKAGGQQVGREGFREVKQPDGSTKKIPNHTPGHDMTFSAPKSISIAALVNKDERLTKAHDAAVRIALDYVQQHAIVTRQRDSEGGYVWRNTGSMVAGVVRHSTSRNLDPQLHSHAVIANMTRDPATGQWVSIDSRAGLYPIQREAGNAYMNALAEGARQAGYTIEWRVDERGNATFELAEISEAERREFSSRRREIEAQLAAVGIDPATASGKARQAATLDTRSPKEHLPGSELHARWAAQAKAGGFDTNARPESKAKPRAEQRMRAAREAVNAGIASLSERKTRFTRREIMTEATTYAQGKATQKDLAAAIVEAHESGTLIDRGTQVRGYSKELETAAGFTTAAAMETEAAMLRRAASIAARAANLTLSGERVDALIAAREQASGHAFSAEQRAATHAILEGRGSLDIVQGYAGTAKTTSVLATISDAAREQGVRVRAIAPTHSAADTLGAAIRAESQTVAALNSKPLARDGRPEIWIVDESGMAAAVGMKTLLARADQAGAQVVLTGDTKQIGSVGAGSAFQQLQDAHPERVLALTDIKRQTSTELKSAVYASLQGRFSDALAKVDTREIKVRDDAVAAIADAYMQRTAQGKETLVVTLSRDDRRDVNAAVQQRRVDAGEVHDVQTVTTLQSRGWTKAEKRDASRYEPGMVIEAGRNFRNGPQRGELATVTAVMDGKVTATRANGETWTFDPARTKKYQVLDRDEQRIGKGDRIMAKGSITAHDVTDPVGTVSVKNGAGMTVEGGSKEADTLIVRLDDGRRVALDTTKGVKADLAYAATANQAQGQTTDVTIAYMRSGQTNLADRQHAYVALSRAREHATVVTDDREKLAATLEKSAHGKETARLSRTEQEAGATESRQVDAADEKRPLTAWAKDLAGDMLARVQNAREDARIAARARAQERLAKRDRNWLARGERVGERIDRNAARIERDIARRSGVKMDRGVFGQLFESKREIGARRAIEHVRAGSARARANVNASLDRAFDRSVAREMRAGASGEEARQRVLERTLIDRDFRFEKAMYAAGAAIVKGAEAAAAGANRIWERVQELRAGQGQPQAPAVADGVNRIWDRVQELRAGSADTAINEPAPSASITPDRHAAALLDADQAEPQQDRDADTGHGADRDGPDMDMG